MRILLVNEYRIMSGAEVIVANLIKYLTECGHVTQLITAEDMRQNPTDMNSPEKNSFTGYLESFKPDVVHFHNITCIGLEPIKICKERGVPCLLTLHDYYIVCQSRMYYRFDRNEECRANNWNECGGCKNNVIGLPHPREIFETLKDIPIVCISKYQESIIRRFGYENTSVIYNGIVI